MRFQEETTQLAMLLSVEITGCFGLVSSACQIVVFLDDVIPERRDEFVLVDNL